VLSPRILSYPALSSSPSHLQFSLFLAFSSPVLSLSRLLVSMTDDNVADNLARNGFRSRNLS